MDPQVLAYDEQGTGDPLVLVPGGLTGWLSWIPFVEPLSKRWRTIRVQPIGNERGSAGAPGDPSYTSITERESLRLTLDELAIDVTHLVGWSGGGRALIEFALGHPGRVRSLTLIEPAAYWILEELGERSDEVEHINQFIHGLAGADVTEEDLAEFLVLAGFVASSEAAPQHPMWERWLPHRMALSWQGKGVDRSGRHVNDLSTIATPTLLFFGSDTTAWLKRVVGILGSKLPRATTIELPGDHACHIQNPDAFLEALTKHLNEAS